MSTTPTTVRTSLLSSPLWQAGLHGKQVLDQRLGFRKFTGGCELSGKEMKQDWAEGDTGLRYRHEKDWSWLTGSSVTGTVLQSCFKLGQGDWVFIPGANLSLDVSLPPEGIMNLARWLSSAQGCRCLSSSALKGDLGAHHNIWFTCLHKKQDGKS